MEILKLSVLRHHQDGQARRIWMLKKEMRLLGTAGILIGYFTLAWMPYIIFEFVSVKTHPDNVDRYVRWVKAFFHQFYRIHVHIAN